MRMFFSVFSQIMDECFLATQLAWSQNEDTVLRSSYIAIPEWHGLLNLVLEPRALFAYEVMCVAVVVFVLCLALV